MSKKLKSLDEALGESESYHVVLSNYDGPLDLLLDLVKRAKIRIEDIFISDITEQYLAAMEQVEELDLDQAADFIEIAATLLEIKSRALLPRQEEPQAPEDDPKTELINRLEEYRLYKEAADKMREKETINMLYRAPDDSVGQPRLVLKDMTTEGLVKALKKMFEKIGVQRQIFKTRKIELDPFTVEQKMDYIVKLVNERTTIIFDDLFSGEWNKSEIVTTFLALLELLKKQVITATQNEIFEKIYITKRSETFDTDADGE